MDRKTGLIIKQAIDSVYTGGVDVLLSYKTDEDGTITGFFRDRGQNYSYTITPRNKITYVEADANRQDSAYLEGLLLTDYALLSGCTSAYTQSVLDTQLSRFDSSKPKQCKEGKPCGGTCIPKNNKCQQNLGLQESKQLDKARRNKILQLGTGILVGGGLIAAGVAINHKKTTEENEKFRKRQELTEEVFEKNKKALEDYNQPLEKNIAIAKAAKEEYEKFEAKQKRQEKISKEIQRISKQMDDPNLSPEQIAKLLKDLDRLNRITNKPPRKNPLKLVPPKE